MYQRTLLATAALALIALGGLATPDVAAAQGNESDVDFLKRMISSLKQTEKQAGRLADNIERASKQAKTNALSRGYDPTGTQDRYGSHTRNTTGNRDADYRRAEMRVRSTRNQAEKERERLADLQRSDTKLTEDERADIEGRVARLEREVINMNRDMQLGRF